MDFVPSTRRPPRGGPSLTGGANDGGLTVGGPGEEGPAPGDCSGLLIATDGRVGVYFCCGDAGRADRGPETEGVVEDARLPLVTGAVFNGGGIGLVKSSSGGM